MVTLIIAAATVIIAPFFAVVIIAMLLSFGARDLGDVVLVLVINFLGVSISVCYL
jgi:hypothetical protein